MAVRTVRNSGAITAATSWVASEEDTSAIDFFKKFSPANSIIVNNRSLLAVRVTLDGNPLKQFIVPPSVSQAFSELYNHVEINNLASSAALPANALEITFVKEYNPELAKLRAKGVL